VQLCIETAKAKAMKDEKTYTSLKKIVEKHRNTFETELRA